jgi:HEAT repeat protein
MRRLGKLALGMAVMAAWTSSLSADGADEAARLMAALKDKDEIARRSAAQELGKLGQEGKLAAPALADVLTKDKDSFVRRFAAQSLGQLGKDVSSHAVPALAKVVKTDSHKEVVQAALEALGQMGAAGVPPLKEALKSNEISIQYQAAKAIGQIGPDAKDAVKTLIDVFKNPPQMKRNNNDAPPVRTAVAEALGNIGPAAKDAVPALKESIGDKVRDREFKKAVETALRKIQS